MQESQENNKKSVFLPIAIGLLILIILIGALFFIRVKKENTAQKTFTNQQINISKTYSQKCNFFTMDKWNTFNDTNGIYSFKYPDCWKYYEDAQAASLDMYTLIRADESQRNIQLSLWTAPYFHFGGIINAGTDLKEVSKKTFQISGYSATEKLYQFDEATCYQKYGAKANFCKANGTQDSVLDVYIPMGLPGSNNFHAIEMAIYYNPSDTTDYSSLMDKILSTLKIN